MEAQVVHWLRIIRDLLEGRELEMAVELGHKNHTLPEVENTQQVKRGGLETLHCNPDKAKQTLRVMCKPSLVYICLLSPRGHPLSSYSALGSSNAVVLTCC